MTKCYEHEECEFNGRPECRLPDSMECPHGVKDHKPMVSHGIKIFLNYLRETEQQFCMAEQTEREANDATQDILHWFELYDFRGLEAVKMAHKLREIRHQRREAKDLEYVTSPLIEWINGNQSNVKGLERVLGEVRKRERKTENRIYTPKTSILQEKV